MKYSSDQIARALKSGLKSFYLVAGDEPLLCQETLELIRAAAIKAGFSERRRFIYEKGFDWNELIYEINNQSLFASRKIIELRLTSYQIGELGAKTILSILGAAALDSVLIIAAPKLDANAQRAKWVKEFIAQGELVQVWAVDSQQLPVWLEQRSKKKGLFLSPAAIELLVERVEGNLLAAAQEIEKLFLLNGKGQVDIELLKQSIADSARFSVYTLVDACLLAQIGKITHIIEGLKSEGIEPVLVLWALTREIRMLTQIAQRCEAGQTVEQALNEFRVWERRKSMVRSALLRYSLSQWFKILAECEKIDRQVKGMDLFNPWDSLLRLSLILAGRFLFYPKVRMRNNAQAS